MMMTLRYSMLIALALLLGAVWLCLPLEPAPAQGRQARLSGAAKALDHWAFVRAYPGHRLRMAPYSRSFEQHKQLLERLPRGRRSWEALGPKNIAGRTLCLAINPQNNRSIYAGSASGGLWRTHTAGEGASAWHRVPTGFPLLGVAAVAISPADTNTLFIGTGEVYNDRNTAPGLIYRLTRGTYGIGILKSTDGGQSWHKSLDWAYGELRGVMEIVFNPLNSRCLYAATTEGLYRSTDEGENWTLIHAVRMAIDVEIHPSDTSTIWVSHGNLGSEGSGVYASTDWGRTFGRRQGVPPYNGKTMLTIHPQNPHILYASVADAFASRGLFRSEDGGNKWTLINPTDVARWQGWYSHDIALDPNEPNKLLYVGIDCWTSENEGRNLVQRSFWNKWDFSVVVQPGEPEGPPDFVHGDIHAAYYDPIQPGLVYVATDGGVYKSTDGGKNWRSCNGGYQSTQFYPGFANSTTDSSFALGGMQDNSTAIYLGSVAWRRVIGGDGFAAAIDPLNDSILYGSYQSLNIARSLDRGNNFAFLDIPLLNEEKTSFAGPYALAPGLPTRMYAARQYVYRSDDRGDSWTPTSEVFPDAEDPVISLEISPLNPDKLYVGMAPVWSPPARVLKSLDAGKNWIDITAGLPDRVPMDFAIHPHNDEQLYVAFAGFGSPHVYQSTDGGASWQPSDAGLPDVPANSLLIDPLNPHILYLGNDLGVYVSTDAGAHWQVFSQDLPDATLVMDLSISPANRMLRVATHGLGVYQTPLLESEVPIEPSLAASFSLKQNYPNPVRSFTTIELDLLQPGLYVLGLYNLQGRLLQQLMPPRRLKGKHRIRLDARALAAGMYVYRLYRKDPGGDTLLSAKKLLKI